MIILLDLDGTLTDTAHEKFKPYKDGLSDFEISEIPVFPNAIEFIEDLNKSHFVIIVSDSHPKYVNKIASEIFGLEISNTKVGINKSEIVDSLSQVVYLADKPNIEKTYNHLSNYAYELDPHCPMIHSKEDKDEFLMIGDSWLDIELGRRLNIRTVLTSFYKATSIEERDGIGQEWKPIKMGPTYYANTFEDIKQIIENPNKNLLALEAIFQGETSENMVRFLTRRNNDNFIAFRCLARQEDGECDRFARADKYYQIDNPERTAEFISLLAKSVTNYLNRVAKFPQYHWDYITYVSDKKTTTPPNKMKEIFDLVETSLEKVKLFKWADDVTGSLRNQPNYQSRRDFISANLKTIQEIELEGKNIIVIDDQFTSSATANEISQQLRNKGVKNILFVSLFYLILPIESKNCPQCGKALKIKINKKNGNKFYSCLPPKFGGQGCGFIENIPTLQQIPTEKKIVNNNDLLYRKIIVGNYYFNKVHNLSNCYGYFIWNERMHITEDFVEGFNEDVLGDTLGLVQKESLSNEICDSIEILDLYNLNLAELEPLYICSNVKYKNLSDNDILPPENFVLKFPQLKEVRLSYCKNLTEEYINTLKNWNSNLKIDVQKIP